MVLLGVVWLASWNLLQVAVKQVTISVINSQVLQSIQEEVKFAASLRHPNVVQLYGICFHRNTEPWIVMELAEGSLYGALSDKIQELSWATRWKWASEAAAALAFLHSKHIIHRDIKSPNFLLVGGRLKLADFGTSKLASMASISTRTVAAEISVGSARWAAPESIQKKPIVNEQTDVYALGLVLWEIVARQIPFAEVTDNSKVLMLVKYDKERPDIPDDCPELFSLIIQRCWQQYPEDRPSSQEVHKFFAENLEMFKKLELDNSATSGELEPSNVTKEVEVSQKVESLSPQSTKSAFVVPSSKEIQNSVPQIDDKWSIKNITSLFSFSARGKNERRLTKDEQLEQQNEPILHAFERGADEALVVVNVEGTIKMVGLSTEKVLGYEKKMLIGHRIVALFDETTGDYVMEKITQLQNRELESVQDISQNLHARHASGEHIPVAIAISSINMNSQMHIGLFIKDISLLRSLESQMEKERAIASAYHTKLRDLFLNVFPKSVAEQLLRKEESSYQPQLIAEEYKQATILFAHIVGFSTLCSEVEPGAFLLILDGIFTQWDALIEKYKLQKIKTIGGSFMAAGGVPERVVDHVERVIDFAMEMREILHQYNDTCQLLKSRSLVLNVRIGINTGPVIAGVIGRSRTFYDVWGEAVNVAAKIESTSIVGQIQVSQTTFNRVKNNYEFEERGSIAIKGKGPILTFLLVAARFARTQSGKVIDNRFAQFLKERNSID